MTELVILVPVLGRPHRVEPLLASIERATPGARVLFLADPGDNEEISAVQMASDRQVCRVELDTGGGNYARKINRGVQLTDEPLLFLGADDLDFKVGWLEEAKTELQPGIGVVGTNDLGSRRVMEGLHATHSLVTRAYAELGTIDEAGKLLHEGYPHEFVDDEFVATAKHRGAWAFASDSHVEHLHPNWGKAPMDRLYRGQRRRMRVGRQIFLRREPLWT
jgi:hypothetical protein